MAHKFTPTLVPSSLLLKDLKIELPQNLKEKILRNLVNDSKAFPVAHYSAATGRDLGNKNMW